MAAFGGALFGSGAAPALEELNLRYNQIGDEDAPPGRRPRARRGARARDA